MKKAKGPRPSSNVNIKPKMAAILAYDNHSASSLKKKSIKVCHLTKNLLKIFYQLTINSIDKANIVKNIALKKHENNIIGRRFIFAIMIGVQQAMVNASKPMPKLIHFAFSKVTPARTNIETE